MDHALSISSLDWAVGLEQDEHEYPGSGEKGGENETHRKGPFRGAMQDFFFFFGCQLIHFYRPRLRHMMTLDGCIGHRTDRRNRTDEKMQASVESVWIHEACLFWLMRVKPRWSLGSVIVIAVFVVFILANYIHSLATHAIKKCPGTGAEGCTNCVLPEPGGVFERRGDMAPRLHRQSIRPQLLFAALPRPAWTSSRRAARKMISMPIAPPPCDARGVAEIGACASTRRFCTGTDARRVAAACSS